MQGKKTLFFLFFFCFNAKEIYRSNWNPNKLWLTFTLILFCPRKWNQLHQSMFLPKIHWLHIFETRACSSIKDWKTSSLCSCGAVTLTFPAKRVLLAQRWHGQANFIRSACVSHQFLPSSTFNFIRHRRQKPGSVLTAYIPALINAFNCFQKIALKKRLFVNVLDWILYLPWNPNPTKLQGCAEEPLQLSTWINFLRFWFVSTQSNIITYAAAVFLHTDAFSNYTGMRQNCKKRQN